MTQGILTTCYGPAQWELQLVAVLTHIKCRFGYTSSVTAADVIKNARYRAGLTQADLARRSGVPRTSIARWEAETREPSLATVQAMVAACGLSLDIGLSSGDASLRDQVHDQRELSPRERIESLLPRSDARAAWRALQVIAAVPVPCVVIGSIAAVLQGTPQRPAETEVEVVASDPLALTESLRERRFEPVDDQRRFRVSDQRWAWTGPRGVLVALASAVPAGGDYATLKRAARPVPIDDGEVLVAHPRDLLRLAEASVDPGERARIPGLHALLA